MNEIIANENSDKEYILPVTWQAIDNLKVKASSLQEAIEYVNEHIDSIPLGDNPGYVIGSYKVSGNFEEIYGIYNKESLLAKAKALIKDYYREEFDDDCKDVSSDLEHIGLAYTEISDYDIPIQVECDLINCQIRWYINNNEHPIFTDHYDNLDELINNELCCIDFEELIYRHFSSDDGEELANSFYYGGHFFFPYGYFVKEKWHGEIAMLLLRSFTELGLWDEYFANDSRPFKYEYSHEDFYKAADSEYDIFKCLDNGKLYVPCEHELMAFEGYRNDNEVITITSYLSINKSDIRDYLKEHKISYDESKSLIYVNRVMLGEVIDFLKSNGIGFYVTAEREAIVEKVLDTFSIPSYLDNMTAEEEESRKKRWDYMISNWQQYNVTKNKQDFKLLLNCLISRNETLDSLHSCVLNGGREFMSIFGQWDNDRELANTVFEFNRCFKNKNELVSFIAEDSVEWGGIYETPEECIHEYIKSLIEYEGLIKAPNCYCNWCGC